VRTSRARNKIRAFFKQERREDAEQKGRDALEEALRKRGLPMQKLVMSPLLAQVIKEMGFRKATEFYIALGQGKIGTKAVANKLMQRLKEGEAVEEEPVGLEGPREDTARRTKDASNYGIRVKGAENVAVRLAKCCRPVPGDTIAGYVSLGRGITIHRADCKNVKALMKSPERFVEVAWEGENESSYKVELQIDAYDRTRLLEDLSRTFSEAGINILGASCMTKHPMVKNRFVVEVGDTEQLKQCISRLRNVEAVFDAYRITPTS
jgi:GTP diphosphokinase / guanosine-3',5'-bis(diphosphate) 3'-diphosphatase